MSSTIIRRALLYVPASSKKFLDKSRNFKVDCVAYDLEDSVTPGKKQEARENLRHFLSEPRPAGIGETAVRINAVASGLALSDLTQVLQAPTLDAIVVPKVNSAADLHFVTDVIRHTLPARHPPSGGGGGQQQQQQNPQPPLRLLALIESARAVMDLRAICAASPYLSGLIFAAEDFAQDMSMSRTPALTEFLYARSAIATACRAFRLPSAIDLVCTAYRGDDGLRTLEEECVGGRNLGFNGKQLIHPSQVEVCQRAFSPSVREVEWAVRVVVADEKADRQGRGAWTLDGSMIDAPVVKKAQAVVEKAELCGMDVKDIRSKWAHQEPE